MTGLPVDDEATGRCIGCHPGDLPEARLHEGHVAIRLGDTPTPRWDWRVTLGGRDVTGEVTEACAGPDGFVVVHDRNSAGDLFACPDSLPPGGWSNDGPDGTHLRAHVERGQVTVERIPTGVAA